MFSLFTLLFLCIILAVVLILGRGPWVPPYGPWNIGGGLLLIVIVVLTILWLVQGSGGAPLAHR